MTHLRLHLRTGSILLIPVMCQHSCRQAQRLHGLLLTGWQNGRAGLIAQQIVLIHVQHAAVDTWRRRRADMLLLMMLRCVRQDDTLQCSCTVQQLRSRASDVAHALRSWLLPGRVAHQRATGGVLADAAMSLSMLGCSGSRIRALVPVTLSLSSADAMVHVSCRPARC